MSDAPKTLLEIEDELSTARLFVECSFHACHALDDDGDGIAAVLNAASDKLKAIGEALSVIRGRL